MISAAAKAIGLHVHNQPLHNLPRKSGPTLARQWPILAGPVRALIQTIAFARRICEHPVPRTAV